MRLSVIGAPREPTGVVRDLCQAHPRAFAMIVKTQGVRVETDRRADPTGGGCSKELSVVYVIV
jgi:hypothetical protein